MTTHEMYVSELRVLTSLLPQIHNNWALNVANHVFHPLDSCLPCGQQAIAGSISDEERDFMVRLSEAARQAGKSRKRFSPVYDLIARRIRYKQRFAERVKIGELEVRNWCCHRAIRGEDQQIMDNRDRWDEPIWADDGSFPEDDWSDHRCYFCDEQIYTLRF